MTLDEEGKREALKYRLAGSQEPIGSWGHEYVRHIAMEAIDEFKILTSEGKETDHLVKLAIEILPFFLSHNADADACDLLIEFDQLSAIVAYVDKTNYSRISLYLTSCTYYETYPDDLKLLKIIYEIHRKMDEYPSMLLIALKLNDIELMKSIFHSCSDYNVKKQLAFMLARQRIFFEIEDEKLNEILRSSRQSEYFLKIAKDLDIIEPKTPEEIYKIHLESRTSEALVDSAQQNLASSFVNAFINVGFSKDKLMLTDQITSTWIFKNKENGMLASAASIGSILMWNVDGGLGEIDKYLSSNDDSIKAGALLAIGILNNGIRDESDPALALLSEGLSSAKSQQRFCAIMGLGIAYAGTCRQELADLLLPIICDTTLTMELSSIAALAFGQIFVGSCHGDATSAILQAMMERSNEELKSPFARFMSLGLALLYFNRQELADATLETLKVIDHPVSKQTTVLVEICAYAGTGNVLHIQKMLHYCTDHIDSEKEDSTFQTFAVLGISLIAMGEEIGAQMALRSFNHLMHYGEINIKRAVPLAQALLFTSHPQMNVLDILSKYSHDNDKEVSINAIFAMGIVGAGTNNARLAQMLRQLASYYYKEPNCLFAVRISQGLIHLAKGSMTLNPIHCNRLLISPVSVCGLLSTVLSFTVQEPIIFGNYPHMLYYLTLAMNPRTLCLLSDDLEPVAATVRVGTAVDTVGIAGKPKTITGFQTHSSPVLIGVTERAELGTEEWIPLSPILEGYVILRKNPLYSE